MSGVLDRLIARIAGDASGDPALRAPSLPSAVAAGAGPDWAGEVVEEHLAEQRPTQASRAASADVDEHGPTAARANPSPQIAASQGPAMLRQLPDPQPPASLGTGKKTSGRCENQPAMAPMAARPHAEIPVQTLDAPKREVTVLMRPAPAAPAFQSASVKGEREPTQSQQAGSSIVARPDSAPSNPDDGDDESETLIIEIGRIELMPPMQSSAGPAPMRRERTVTLSSYLADRREGRR
jgi:hypothetical protein